MSRNLFKTKLMLIGCDQSVARCYQDVARCDQVAAMYDFMLPEVTKPHKKLPGVARCDQIIPFVTSCLYYTI